MSALLSPLLLVLAFQGVVVSIRTAGQIVLVCIALRGTAPEQRARILQALHGKTDAVRGASQDLPGSPRTLNSRPRARHGNHVPD
jgi:hypothetical protein